MSRMFLKRTIGLNLCSGGPGGMPQSTTLPRISADTSTG